MAGQQRTMLSLLDACAAAGIEPLVAVTAEGVFVDRVHERRLPVECFRYPETLARYGGAIYRYRGLARARMGLQLLSYLSRIRRRLRGLAVDGVFCNDMRGLLTVGLAARTLGLPVMIWDKLDKPHGWLDLLQLPLANVNAVIACAVTAKYPNWQRRVFSRRIIPVFEGADLARFDGARGRRRELPGDPTDVILGIVGTITERKGHDRLLAVFPEACRRSPRLRLVIIGETSGSKEDELYLRSLRNLDHPRVHLLGMREDVPDLMKLIDILAVPSRHEGMGLVIVEAMAAGRPVIGARAGGIPEVVLDGETGLLFDGEDPGQLLACIERMAGSRELRARMGEAGRRRVEAHFNRPVQMRKILALCAGMIEGRRGTPERDRPHAEPRRPPS